MLRELDALRHITEILDRMAHQTVAWAEARLESDLGELSQTALEPLPRAGRAAHDQDGIVASDRAEHIGPRFAVQCGRNGLGPTRNGPNDDDLPNPIDARQKLRQ
jgi:hypothetical protein